MTRYERDQRRDMEMRVLSAHTTRPDDVEHVTVETGETCLGDAITIAVYATGVALFTGWAAQS